MTAGRSKRRNLQAWQRSVLRLRLGGGPTRRNPACLSQRITRTESVARTARPSNVCPLRTASTSRSLSCRVSVLTWTTRFVEAVDIDVADDAIGVPLPATVAPARAGLSGSTVVASKDEL